MQNLKLQDYTDTHLYISFSNLYLDEALKRLKLKEFKTYMSIIAMGKVIGPNLTKLFGSKKDFFRETNRLFPISEKTFLKHLKTIESLGLLTFSKGLCDLGFDISDAKNGGYTEIHISDLALLLNKLNSLEFKLYMALKRQTKGFQRKSYKASYGHLKVFTNIKSNTSISSGLESLKHFKLISSVTDVNTGKITYRMNHDPKEIFSIEVKNELHQVENEQVSHNAAVKNEPIKRDSTFLKKYSKKSSPKKEKFDQKARIYRKQNREKIFLFLDDHSKTKYFTEIEKWDFIDILENEVKVHGCFKGRKIKSTPDFYLSQDHPQFGRVIDKIIDRYFYRQELETRENESRKIYLKLFKAHFPEKVENLSDFKTNDLSKAKLDKLMRISPQPGFWNDHHLLKIVEQPNPDFDPNAEKKSKELFDSLLEEGIGEGGAEIEDQLDLLGEIAEEVERKYPVQSKTIELTERKSFDEFAEEFR